MSDWSEGWYDRGGYLPAASAVCNDTGEAIRVSTREQIQASQDYIREQYRDEEEDVD